MADENKTSAAVYIEKETYLKLTAAANERVVGIGYLASRLIDRALENLTPVGDVIKMSGEE